jgi:hypothetical protein
MTEQEWLECLHPRQMLEFLQGKASDRKLRLFAVACLRRCGIDHSEIRLMIRISELYADGLANWTELASVRKMARRLERDARQRRTGMGAGFLRQAASVARPSAFEAARGVLFLGLPNPQRELMLDIFGPLPFRPVALNPVWLAWQDATIPKLAQAIYGDGAFDPLPVLADVLEEAGCRDPEILAHCRQPGEHVRGCWVVDHILGKK